MLVDASGWRMDVTRRLWVGVDGISVSVDVGADGVNLGVDGRHRWMLGPAFRH